MNTDEKLALAVALLTASITQLFDQVAELKRQMQDLQDIFKGCACFNADEQQGWIEP